ncbi:MULTISPECIES: hypothetical protein [Burkholderia]|uniref:hypothetical protein n=1 Tax=Burkholderia TaxID=32008 RepID=UPI0012E345EC|nr:MULTISPECIES: hypothetical protein [Burkholderia]
MNILCFYGYVCEDHDAIDFGVVGEHSFRTLQFAARTDCNARRCPPGARATIASGSLAAANALVSMANAGRPQRALAPISIDEIVRCRAEVRLADDVFTQRGTVRRTADAVCAPAYRFRKMFVGPHDARR